MVTKPGTGTADLESRIRELEELNSLAQKLGSTLNVQDTLAAIAETCQRLCHADRVALLLIDPSSDQEAQTLVRRSDESEGGIDHIVNLLAAQKIMHDPKAVATDDITTFVGLERPSDSARLLGPAIVVPLFADKKLIGIINLVNSKGGRKFNSDAERLVSLIATLAAQYIQRAKLHQGLFQDTVRLKEILRERVGPGSLLGESPTMKEVRQKIESVAESQLTVLLIGETGTGKELAAHAIHFGSLRADKPFIALNCAAIPQELFESELFGHERGAFTGAGTRVRGKFELADQGTLFLDEVSSLPAELQPKLLRVIEQQRFYRVGSEVETRVDVRLIAATSSDLELAVEERTFRPELYHRLSVVPILLPPLRERLEDVPLLAQTFLRDCSSGAKVFSPDALELLSRLPWKGNVRELKNAVERISIFVRTGTINALQVQQVGIGSELVVGSLLRAELLRLLEANKEGGNLVDSMDRHLTLLALEKAHGNISHAARLLGVDRHALQRRIEKHGLDFDTSQQ
ncbi:MAG: sigma 54-interacting transcriptional regulator [Bacteroidota bacterium]